MKNFKETHVEEMAYLLSDDKNIGVTNDPADIVAYLKDKETDSNIVIYKGYKEDLLGLQQRMLLCDEAFSNINNDNIVIPHKQCDYNIVERRGSKCKLLEVIKFVDKDKK